MKTLVSHLRLSAAIRCVPGNLEYQPVEDSTGHVGLIPDFYEIWDTRERPWFSQSLREALSEEIDWK